MDNTAHPNGNRNVVVATKAQIRARADKIAQDLLQVSHRQVFRMIDTGELRGTLAEAALTPLRDMLAR